MNRYQREALAEIQAKSDARMLRLAAGLSKVMGELPPLGKRPRLSRRLQAGRGILEATRNARRLYEALREIQITELNSDTEERLSALEDDAVAALTALVEDMK